MDPVHNISSKLDEDKRKILAQIAMNIVEELVMLDGDINSQNIIIASDIAMAIDALLKKKDFHARTKVVYSVDEIQTFFDLHIQEMLDLASELYALDEKELYQDICMLGQLLYPQRWNSESLVANEKALLATENSRIILYRAKNGELAIRFPNEEARIAFCKNFTPATIPAQFRQGPQYLTNPEGLTPVTYLTHPKHLFIPSYKALNGEFAINCGSKINRDHLLQMLGLKITGTKIVNRVTATSFADDLFTIYAFHLQDNAIYFNSANKIFTQEGAFIKIDRSTGELRQTQIKDYKKTVEELPLSRFGQRDQGLAASELGLMPAAPVKIIAPVAEIPEPAKEAPELLVAELPKPAIAEIPQIPAGIIANPVVLPLASKNYSFSAVYNSESNFEIDITFPDQASRDQLHAVFVKCALSIGVLITHDSLVEKSNEHSSLLRFKASHGRGNVGVHVSASESKSLFQAQPRLGIDFGDEQLRELFLSIFNLNDELVIIQRDNSAQAKTLTFKAGVLNPQGKLQFEGEFNKEALENYVVLFSELEIPANLPRAVV